MIRKVSAAAAAGVVFLACHPVMAQLVAFDDFNRDGNTALGSTPVGNFLWHENEYEIIGPDQIRIDDIFGEHPGMATVNSRGSGTDPSALIDVGLQDVDLSATFNSTKQSDNYFGSLLYRFPDTTSSSAGNRSGYAVDVTQNDWDSPLRGPASISLRWQNNVVLAVYNMPTAIVKDAPFTVRVTSAGTLQTVYLNGTSVLTYDDPDPTHVTSGAVGFGGYYGNWAFDDFSVTALTISAPKWNTNGNGNWSDTTNWQGSVPNAVDAIANFTDAITGPAVVTVDAPQTVGAINFDNANSYSIAGANPITMDVSTGSALIKVNSGSHNISAPLSLAKDTTLTVTPAGSTLNVSGDITAAAGVNLTKDGAGEAIVNNIRTTGGLTVSSGTLAMAAGRSTAGTSKVTSLLVSAGATLDLNDQDMVVDYSGATSPRADIRARLVGGFNNGAWNGTGIASSVAAAVAANPSSNNKTGLGYAEASQVLSAGSTIFSGQSADSDAVLIRYTYYGDSNLDGVVSSSDFDVLASNFNMSGREWVDGDFNYDGTVNALDFNALATNFGRAAIASPLGAVVPEPVSLGMVATIGTALSLRRRRRRRAC
jgi:dockerin type I repeat protein